MQKAKLFLCVLLVLTASACANASPWETQCPKVASGTVMIQTATTTEYNAVLAEVDNIQKCTVDHFEYVLATENNNTLVVFLGGIGPEYAPFSTELMIKTVEPKAIIFSGTAGGLNGNATIGETFLVEYWHNIETKEKIEVSLDLYVLAMLNGIDATYVEHGVTSPTFISDQSIAAELSNTFSADIVNMEDYYVAEIAAKYNILFISVRSISDMANGGVEASNRTLAATNSARIALEIADAIYVP